MRHSAKLLSLATLTALLFPTLEVTATSLQESSFFKGTRTLPGIQPWYLEASPLQHLAQADSRQEADRLLEQGIQQYQVNQFQEALQSWEHALAIYRDIGDLRGEGSALEVLGRAYLSLNEYEQAIEFFQQSLNIAREVDYYAGEGRALRNIGIGYYNLGDYEQAADLFRQHLTIIREIGDSAEAGVALGYLDSAADQLLQQGVEQYQINQFEAALKHLQQALSIYQETDNRTREGETLGSLGNAHASVENYQQAISFYEQSLLIFRETANFESEQATSSNLAQAARQLLTQGIELRNQGQPEAAIPLFEASLGALQTTDHRQGESFALDNLGNAYFELSQYEQAIAFYKQSLAIAHELGDRTKKGDVLGNLGTAYYNLGQYEQAIDFSEQQLTVTREIGDRAGEGRALEILGNAYLSLREHRRAIDLFQQSLAIAHDIGDRAGEGRALGNLGSAYSSIGEYWRAIDLFQQSLAAARDTGDRAGEGATLGNLGLAYSHLGEYQQAIELHEQALAISREMVDRIGEGTDLNNLAVIYEAIGNYQQAIRLSEQSLMIALEIGDRSGEGFALGNLGNAYRQLREYQQAITFYQQRFAIAQEVGDRLGESRALGNLASTYGRLGEYQRAIDFYQQSIAIKREIGDLAGEAVTLYNQSANLIEVEQFPQAEILLRQSIDVYESLRTGLSDGQLISIADKQARAYSALERVLIPQDKAVEALVTTERGRGRAFVLQLVNRLSREEERAALEASPVAQVPTVEEIQQIARDTNTTLVTYSLIFDQALYIWVVQPSGDIEFREVEFDGSGENGLAVNPITSIDGPVYRSASPDSALTALVTDSRSAVNESGNPNTPQLQELHKLLIDPIADLLPSDPNAQIVFIPQGQLFLVPFAALQAEDGTYLIEKHTILTAPSIQVYGLASEAGSLRLRSESENNRFLSGVEGNALVVGNPTMPTVWLPTDDGFAETQLSYLSGAKAEAEAIGEFFNIPVLTGEQATEARIKQELPNASLIHLATHGLLEYGIPESSGVLDLPGAVALAPGNGEDGLLTSAEILAMDLQADLAILSACDTGRGRITGDGVVGLSRALITAGVPSVMVSLWAVNDASTSVLMQRFYEFLATGELTKAEALRQAQLSLLYDEDVATRLEAVRAGAAPTFREGFEPVGTRHPYHWAPFVLIGNGQ